MSRKAGGAHPRAGRVFAVSLALVYVAILINIVVKANVFMLGIGWLAVFASTEGWRALRRFQGRLPLTPTRLDYLLNGATALLSIGLLAFGAWAFVATSNPMGLVCAGFGLLGAVLVRQAWRRWQAPPPKPRWLAIHIGMMTGAFGAALTAFLALQFSGRLGSYEWVLWIAPTVIMSRYAAYETRHRGLS